MDEDRAKHSLAVAKKMVEIAKQYNMNEMDIKNCFVIGINHDIGYEFSLNKSKHNRISGIILKETGFLFWKEIYFHGETDTEYESSYLKILNQADMQIDKFGNDVGYDKRLEDIKIRYGENPNTYNQCCKLVKKIR